MIRVVTAVLATGALLASVALAQQKAPSQGVCNMGYDKAMKGGSLAKLSKDTMKAVDTNKDGKLSKQEFTNACSKKLFEDQEQKGK